MRTCAVGRRRGPYAVRTVVARVALSILAACQPATNTPSPALSALSPIPSAASSVSPPSSPSSTQSVLDDRFGFLVADGHGLAVRSETNAAAVLSFTPEGRSWTSLSNTVSPDGRLVAYWAPVTSGATLHVRGANAGVDRSPFTSAPGLSGNAYTWSSDGSGLVVAVDNDCQEICLVQGGKAIEELWTIDLATGASERIASGKFWLPVTWDRDAKVVAAGVTGPGGYLVGYDVIDLSQKPYAVSSTEFRPAVLGRLKPSSDARFVLLNGYGGSALSWWPLAAPQRLKDVHAFDGTTAEWRPGTSEIWWSSASGLVAMDVVSGAQRTMSGSFGALGGFRVDGTAAMTLQRAPDALAVVDLTTGRIASLPVGGPFVRLR